MTKKSRQKLKYLENEKSFWGDTKRIFVIFKELSVVKNCLRPESATLKPVAFLVFLKDSHLKMFTYAYNCDLII